MNNLNNEYYTEEECRTILSLIIKSDFDVDKALDFYKKLKRDGVLTLNDVLGHNIPGGNEIGWIAPHSNEHFCTEFMKEESQ